MIAASNVLVIGQRFLPDGGGTRTSSARPASRAEQRLREVVVRHSIALLLRNLSLHDA